MNKLYINGLDSLYVKDKPLLTYVKINAWIAPINIENPCHAIVGNMAAIVPPTPDAKTSS